MNTEGFVLKHTIVGDVVVVRMMLISIGGKILKNPLNVKSRDANKMSSYHNTVQWIVDTCFKPLSEETNKEIIRNLYNNPWFRLNTVMESYITTDNEGGYKGYVIVLNSHTQEYQFYFIYTSDKANPTACSVELIDFDCVFELLNDFYEEGNME